MTQTATTTTAKVWNTQAPHQTALDAWERYHWSVIPVDDGKQPPQTGGTHPDGTPKRLGWKKLQAALPTKGNILNWQHKYKPTGWGIITGSLSGIIILDYDGKPGQELIKRYGFHPHVLTPSGGGHQYFQHPGWYVPTLNGKAKEDLGKKWPGLDIRGDGGYAVFCGNNSKGHYDWLREPVPDELSLIPEEIRIDLGLLYHPDSPEAKAYREKEQRQQKRDYLLDRSLDRVSGGHGRDNTCFWLAKQLHDNDFSESEALTLISEYVARVPNYNAKGEHELFTLDTARTKVASAYSYPQRSPWEFHTQEVLTTPQTQTSSDSSNGYHPSEAITEGESSLPQIYLSGQLRERWDVALNALRKAEQMNPTIFVQSARLVQIGQDDKKHPIIMQLGIAELKNALSRSADYYRLKEKGDESIPVPISPPKEIAESILALNPAEWRCPSLEAIVETPVIRPDGSILDTPGYDQATRLYYYPQEGMKACKVPCNPTKADIAAALAIIDEAIGEFPYVEQADRANAYGCLLTPIIRPAIRHVPLALFDAPKQGTGKGLLSDVVSTTATGASAAILTLSDSDEELQKNITALLIEGVTIITIDNLAGKLQSKHLDGVLTADTWRGRILGQSKMVKVPQRATWIATGNNIRLGGDLARRCYRIRLDPHVSRPWMRTGPTSNTKFKHEDLLAWVTEHRAELITALLTLARAWFVAGQPQSNDIPMLGTFTGWGRTIGGILEYCGVKGFLSNLERLYDEADEDSAQWEAFLSAWHERFGDQWILTSDLVREIKAAIDSDETLAGSAENLAGSAIAIALPDALQVTLKEKPASFSIVLGKALERRVEACFGDNNLRIVREKDDHKKIKKWRVVGDLRVVAGSSTPYAQDEKENEIQPINSNIEYGRADYPHYPQQADGNGTSIQATSDVIPPAPLAGSQNTLPAKLQMITPEMITRYPQEVREWHEKHHLTIERKHCLRNHTSGQNLPWFNPESPEHWEESCMQCYPGLRATRGKHCFLSDIEEVQV